MGKIVQVLLVEDSEDDALLLVRTLKSAGYEVRFKRVETKEEMKTALDNQTWDIIISDYNLPHFSGMGALELLQEKGIDLPFILVSGAIGEEMAVNAMKAGANDYVMKSNLARLALAVDREIREAKIRREHKQINELLKENEARFRNLVESATDAIILADTHGKIILWNKGAANLFLHTEEEILGQSLSILMPDQYRDAHQKRLAEISSGKYNVIRKIVEFKGLRKDGTEFPLELSLAEWDTEKGKFFSGIVRDITERKIAECDRIENERMEYASKAKSEFIASMSHELRTPLNSIIGFSDLLLMNKNNNISEKQKNYINNILSSGKFLLSLINNILDLSKIESGKVDFEIEKIPLHITIEETIILMNERASRHNIIIKKEYHPQIDCIEADKQRFKQILFNLLSNAVKFCKKDGTVTIKTKKEGNMAHISVSDTGIGIKEENIGKLFKNFEQLEPEISKQYGGTGLGLVITKQLVEKHGGKIWVESKFGEGSTFSFSMPLEAKPVLSFQSSQSLCA